MIAVSVCNCRLCTQDAERRRRINSRLVKAALFAAALAFALIPVLAGLAAGDELKPGAPPASVVIIDGCSGVNVDPAGLVLTARHCDHNNRERIEFVDGRSVVGRKVFESSDTDGPVVFVIDDPGPFPASAMAADAPNVGDKVYSWGYPAGGRSHARNLSYASGVLTGGRRVKAGEVGMLPLLPSYSANVAGAMAIDGGWSGGPLFNVKGEVIGLASASNDKESLWLPFTACRDAYRVGLAHLPAATARVVTYYTQAGCAPCAQFESHKAAGMFAGYEFKAGDAAADGIDKTPTFVYRGQTKEGYSGPDDLRQWLYALEPPAVYSRPPEAKPEPIADPQPTPTPAAGVTPIKRPTEEIAAVKAQVEKLIADVKAFQDAGIIGKAALINDLRDDVSTLKETTSVAKSEIESIREDYKAATGDDHPWYYGVPAVILGIIKRRYLNRGGEVAEA